MSEDPWADVRSFNNDAGLHPYRLVEDVRYIDALLKDADALLGVAKSQMEMAKAGYKNDLPNTHRSFNEYLRDIWPELAALPDYLRGGEDG